VKRLILTTNDSGGGCLKKARLADKVLCVAHRLVCGPIPPISDPAAFFAERARLFQAEVENWAGWQDWAELERACFSAFDRQWLELTAILKDFDQIELWIDPVPNAQLLLVQLLDWLRPYADIVEKLILVHADTSNGELTTEEIVISSPSRQKADSLALETATLAWEAFRQPTPQAWFDLLRQDLGALPHLRQSVLRLLEELPAVGTALGATETRLLKIVSQDDAAPPDVFANYKRDDDLPVLDYWEVGQVLDQLATWPKPAVLGLQEGPFTMAMHNDCPRFERYKRSKLSLSELGRALVENRDDCSRHNSIHRWWGGTKLTNDCLWRWDVENKTLISPR